MDEALFDILLIYGTMLGLMVGSFLNVVIHRIPRGESIVHPASHCPNCDHVIRWWENIPILSYLLLRGRCRGCRATISIRYPIVELLGGLVVLVSMLLFGWTWSALAGVVMGWNLIALGMIDFETKTVPDILVLTLGIPGLILSFLIGSWTGLMLSFFSAAILGVFFWITRKVANASFGEEAMGEGDITLVVAIGVYLHPIFLPMFLLTASVSVLIAALFWAWSKKTSLRDVEIPFGPGLALGGWVLFVAGKAMMDGLMHLAAPFLSNY